LFLGEEGHWTWFHSGEDLTESSWGPGTPNTNSGNIDDCGVMVVQSGNFWWQDSNCFVPDVQGKKVATVCQYDFGDTTTTVTTTTATTTTTITTTTTTTITTTPTTTPTTTTVKVCPSGWAEFGSHCYQFRTTNHNWKTAEADCVSAGGHLASFHSQAEDAFINKLAGIPRIWLGSSDASSEVLCDKKKVVQKILQKEPDNIILQYV